MILILLSTQLDLPRTYPGCPKETPFYDISNSKCVSQCSPANIDTIQINTKLECHTSGCNQNVYTMALYEGVDLSICIDCNDTHPFFDIHSFRCSPTCGDKDIVVDAQKVCQGTCTGTTTQNKHTTSSYEVSYLECKQCQDINQDRPYGKNGQCTFECTPDLNQIASAYNRSCQETCRGRLQTPLNGEWIKCFDCPQKKPFFNNELTSQDKCDSQCPIASNDSLVCVKCSDFLQRVISGGQVPYYNCTASCPAGFRSGPTGTKGICLSCTEADPSKPFLQIDADGTSKCVSTCTLSTTSHFVDENWKCISSCSGFNKSLKTQSESTETHYQCLKRSVSGANTLTNNVPQATPCAKFQENDSCVDKCTQQTDDNKSVVDQNNKCISVEYNGIIVVGVDHNTFYYKCSDQTFFDGASKKCVSTCPTGKYVLGKNGERVCLMSNCASPDQLPFLDLTDYPIIKCQQTTECGQGFKKINDICVQVDTCKQYAARCTQSLILGSEQECQNNKFDGLTCAATCPQDKPYYLNETDNICVASCNASGLVVGSNKECISECRPYEFNTTEGCATTEKCCGACTNNQIYDGSQCVDNCPTDKPFNQTFKCSAKCDGQQNITIGDKLECIASCPWLLYNHTDQNYQKCIQSCAATDRKFVDTSKTCISACGSNQGVYANNSESYCIDCGENQYLSQQSCVNSCSALQLKVEDKKCVSECTKYNSVKTENNEQVCVDESVNESNQVLIGAIVGGVLGGLVVIIIIILIVLWKKGIICKKKNELKDKKDDLGEKKEKPKKEKKEKVKKVAIQKDLPVSDQKAAPATGIIPVDDMPPRTKSRLTPMMNVRSSVTPNKMDGTKSPKEEGDQQGDQQGQRKKRRKVKKDQADDQE